MHDIAVLYDIIFSLDAEFAGGTARRLAAKSDEIVVFDYLCANETALKIGMDHAGTLRGFAACLESPCTHLVAACRKECTQIQQGISGFA